jgi:hypothetical protein
MTEGTSMGLAPKNTALPDITCPECQARLNPEFVAIVLNGKTVFCENCGFPFVGIEQGKVKSLDQAGVKIRDASEADRRSEQWETWKMEWQRIKSWFKDQFGTSDKKVPPPSQSIEPNPVPTENQISPSYSASQSNISSNSNFIPAQPSYPSYPAPNTDKLIANTQLKHAISIISKFAPIYYLIIILSAIGGIFASISNPAVMVFMIGLLVYAIFIADIDKSLFTPRLVQDDYKHAGLDMIVLGAFSIVAFGAGLLLLVRGVLVVILTNNELKDHAEYRTMCQSFRQNEHIFWVYQLLLAIPPYTKRIAFFLYIAGVLGVIQEQSELPFIIIFSILGFVVFLIFSTAIQPKLEQFPNVRLDSGIGIGCIIIGFIVAPLSGAGSIYIFLGVVMLIYTEMLKNNPQITIIRDEVSVYLYNHQNLGQISTGGSYSPNNFMGFTNIPPPSPVHRIPRFDPATGKPLEPSGQKSELIPPPLENPITPPVPETRPPETPSNGDEKNPNNRIFTVLDPEVRQKLLVLPISENERNEIAEELVAVAKDHQLKYLQEFEDNNAPASNEELDFIARIRRLTVPEDQKQFLLQQLEFLPPGQQADFVRFLEQSTNQTAVK